MQYDLKNNGEYPIIVTRKGNLIIDKVEINCPNCKVTVSVYENHNEKFIAMIDEAYSKHNNYSPATCDHVAANFEYICVKCFDLVKAEK